MEARSSSMQRLTTISPILWVILESGRLRANLKATEARYRQTVAVSGNYLRLAQAQYKFGLVDYLISSTVGWRGASAWRR